MLSYPYRFHGYSSLRYVFKNGETVRSRLLTIRYVSNPRRRQPRFSVSISKKVMKSAVRRNRIRRRIYEVVRLNLPRITGTYDVVFIVTSPDLLGMEHGNLRTAVLRSLGEADLLPADAIPDTPTPDS